MNLNSLFVACAMMFSLAAHTQTGNIYEMPRVMVQGEASTRIEADVIYAWLNIYDNNYTYDYTAPYDDKAFRKKQQDIVDRLGLKDALVSPTYAALAGGTATGPFQVRFSTKAQFEAAQIKAAAAANESYAVSLDFSSADVSPEKRKNILNQMLDQAIADAKTKAERLAKGLGGVLGKPIYIEEIRDYYGAYDYAGEGSMDAMYTTDMMVTITARVQVQYELK